MLGVLTAVLLVGAPVELEASTLDEQTIHGTLVALSDGQLIVESTSGRDTVAQDRLLEVKFNNKVASRPAATTVNLVDGSRLYATRLTVQKDQAKIVLWGGGTLVAPTRAIRFVRFEHAKAASDPDWEAALREEAVGDVIVVRKESTESGTGENKPPVKVSLRNITGVFYDVTDEVVQFKFDENLLDVRREKVEGMVYYHADRELPKRICKVTDQSGATWVAKSITSTGPDLELTTTSGVTHRMPLDRVHKLSFAEGKIVYLSDLEPQTVRWEPLVGSTLDLLEKLNLPRTNVTFDGNPLTLSVDGELNEFNKGLAVRSRTQLSYRLPDDFRRFVATIGIDPQRQGKGSVRLVISGDGRVLLDEEVTAAMARMVEIPLSGISRFGILVDYGHTQDIADHLLICSPRFEK